MKSNGFSDLRPKDLRGNAHDGSRQKVWCVKADSMSESERVSPPGEPNDGSERLFSTAVWLAMSVALIGYVAVYGRNVPYYEDWICVPVLTGQEPVHWSWFTDQVLEHRYVLAKFLLYLLWQVSANDFRVSMFTIALVLSGVAYLLMQVARRLRGRASFADAFFPLTLLSWGAQENVIMFFQVVYLLPVLFINLILAAIASRWWERGMQRAWLLGGAVALLPLNGGIGMCYTPCLLVWLVGVGVADWRTGALEAKRRALIFFTAALLAILVIGVYFIGYASPYLGERSPRTLSTLAATAKALLSVTFGPAGGYLANIVAWGVVGVFAASMFVLIRVFYRSPGERRRASGLFAIIGAAATLVAGIVWGRTGYGPGTAYAFRYAILIVPGVLCSWFVWTLYARAGAARLFDVCLFSVAAAMLIPNIAAGVGYGEWREATADALVADIRDGLPVSLIAERNAARSCPDVEQLERGLRALETSGIGPYRNLPATVVESRQRVREWVPSISVVGGNQVDLVDGVARATGDDPYIVYALPEPVFVRAIRVRFVLTTPDSSAALMRAFWMQSGRNDFSGERMQTWSNVASDPRQQTILVNVDDTLDRFRIDPNESACEFRLLEVVAFGE